MLERRAKQRDRALLQRRSACVLGQRLLQEAGAQPLQVETDSPAPAPEQWMDRQRHAGSVRDLFQERSIRCDDQLSVIGPARLAQMKALATGDEQRLVRIANHVVIANVPDEEAAIWQTHLKLRGVLFLRSPQSDARAAQILDERNR
jgi:hypothetical protein